MYGTDIIPYHLWVRWYELFRLHNGRFTSNPISMKEGMLVSYHFEAIEDYKNFFEGWERAQHSYKEVVPSLKSKVFRKVVGFFKHLRKEV